MEADRDAYEAYYSARLWALLPEVYAAEDSSDPDRPGPLRELVARIGKQAAVLRRDMDRNWENQFIETCDDWVIAYLGDLLATNLVSSLDARGKRLDVANTISYRRRKGTLGVLEEIAGAITGWDAKVVEFFRRLGRCRHGLDPAFAEFGAAADAEAQRALAQQQRLIGELSGTPAGGLADLRRLRGATRAHGPFDEYAYTADVRGGRGQVGWHAIPRLGVFLWRLQSQRVNGSTPLRSASCPNQFSFDPSGRDVPLFLRSSVVHGDNWRTPEEHQLRGPLRQLLLAERLPAVYDGPDPSDSSVIIERSLAIFLQTGSQPDLISSAAISGEAGAAEASGLSYVDAEHGRLFVPPPLAAMANPRITVSYHRGFSSQLGAGPYDRRSAAAEGVVPVAVVGGGDALATALGALGTTGAVQIEDSATYTGVTDLAVTSLLLESDTRCRPFVRLPAATPPTAWTFTGDASANDGRGADLTLSGLWIAGGELILSGDFDQITFRGCTIDPGEPNADFTGYAAAIDGRLLRPCELFIEGAVGTLLIESSIVGPVRLRGAGAVDRLIVRDSIVQDPVPGTRVLDVTTGETEIERSTVLGQLAVRRLEVSESILHDVAVATDLQRGCVRFSAFAEGSTLPKQYESVPIAARAGVFTSLRFSQPGYAQLLESADASISAASAPVAQGARPRTLTEGGPEGSELGAFAREKNAIKSRSLLVKYAEYMPLGLSPVLVYAT